ncbi:MAG: acetyl-CoA carboxylase biotin carboxyl carrier protein subunit [Bacteroidales bacterium]|nr:acetyl-CoA carboxylase biotin carboxyl carrier protein subunit [Bacteroidales bacterium]MCF8404173.1 acetyl-CoA carboxylase biotin carboxyl carrier protein subunit [Bacteroidales bacterium]
MALEVNIDGKSVSVELLGKEGNQHKVSIDGKVYDVDLVMVEEGVYSILYKNKSYNVELIPGKIPKTYTINTLYNSYEVGILDAEAKYLQSRKQDDLDDDTVISSPMPGKVVKILVKIGDKLKAGDTVVIVSAMKMESEYKVKQDRVVKAIKVKEGDTIDGNQPLVIVE